jgi:DNA-binding winged helix-turn-helix (wHTH) protein/tetratricopeptide (TPR) repeat protein
MKMEQVFLFGEFRVDPQDRTLRRNDAPVVLNRRAFDVLLYLVQNPGRVVTKEELLKSIWPGAFVDENNLTQSMSALRRALEEHPGRHNYIATLSGRGYQFIAPVEALVPPAALAPRASVVEEHPRGNSLFLHQRTVTTSVIAEETGQHALPAPRRRFAVPLILLAALVVAGGAGYPIWRFYHPLPTSAKVVIADFQNTTGDATFDRTLTRVLEIDLGQSPYMDVMTEREVVSVLQYMGQPTDSALTPDLARQICERSNREAVLTGSIASLGSSYLLTLEATGCASGKSLAAATAQASTKEGVLAAVDSLADRVRSKLGESVRSREKYQVPTATATTPSLEALKSYSMGNYLDSLGKDETESLPFYQKAVELDPKFAMAWGAMAANYYNQAQFHKASALYAKAFQLSGSISAKEKLIIQAHYFAEGQRDIEGGIKIYKVWAATYPNDWVPVVNLCNQYTQIGQYPPAIEAGWRALQMQPGRGITYSVLARALTRANRFEEAKAVGRQAIQRHQDFTGIHATLYNIAFIQQDQPALAHETAWAAAHSDSWYKWFFPYTVAAADATLGKFQQAETVFLQSVNAAVEEKAVEGADSVLIDQARLEFDFGFPDAARKTLQRVSDQQTDQPDPAVLYAELGDPAPAERYIARYSSLASDTEMQGMSLPRVRSALALLKGKPSEAVAALEPARPYEFYDYTVLAQRGAAYLKAGNGALAAAEYKKILANPGIAPGVWAYPLAHLGLARAYALTGDTAASRNEYAALFAAFQQADPGLPFLRIAAAERAALPAH